MILSIPPTKNNNTRQHLQTAASQTRPRLLYHGTTERREGGGGGGGREAGYWTLINVDQPEGSQYAPINYKLFTATACLLVHRVGFCQVSLSLSLYIYIAAPPLTSRCFFSLSQGAACNATQFVLMAMEESALEEHSEAEGKQRKINHP